MLYPCCFIRLLHHSTVSVADNIYIVFLLRVYHAIKAADKVERTTINSNWHPLLNEGL